MLPSPKKEDQTCRAASQRQIYTWTRWAYHMGAGAEWKRFCGCRWIWQRQENPCLTCPGPSPIFLGQKKGSFILRQKPVRERERVGSPILSKLGSLWNYMRRNRKKHHLMMYTWFLISLSPEDTKLATESHLRSPSPNNMFSSTLTEAYIDTRRGLLQTWVTYVFLTISTSKPTPWSIFLHFLLASRNLTFWEFEMKYHNICCHCKRSFNIPWAHAICFEGRW